MTRYEFSTDSQTAVRTASKGLEDLCAPAATWNIFLIKKRGKKVATDILANAKSVRCLAPVHSAHLDVTHAAADIQSGPFSQARAAIR